MAKLWTTSITSQNREISIYVSCSGVILFNDVTAALILWIRRKLNTLKMVTDTSQPHNIQDYYQPIEQPPITKESLLRLQQPWLHIMYGWMCRGCLRNSSIIAHTCWPFSICFDDSAIPSFLPHSSQSKCYITTFHI